MFELTCASIKEWDTCSSNFSCARFTEAAAIRRLIHKITVSKVNG
jgi:hypothetical protein